MAWQIAFDPLLPLWLIACACGLAAVPVLYGLVRGVRGALIRMSVLALFMLALANPSAIRENRDSLSDVVAVVVDKSPSQRIAGRDVLTEQIRAEIAAQLEPRGNVDVRVVETDANADETRLFEALSTTLADVPPERIAGALFISDGQVHDVPAEAEGLVGGAPIHSLLTGHPDEIDRKVVLRQAPRFGIVGQEQSVSFEIIDESGTGPLPADGQPVGVTLRVDGQDVDRITARRGVEVTLTYELEHGGANFVEVEVDGREGERSIENNRALFTTRGIRDRLRVLLVSGEPHAGERTWRNLLKADGSVDLVHFTILRPPEKQDGTPIDELSLIAFPTRELFSVKLNEFDLIVFDRYQRRGVLPLIYLDNVVEYVRGGGAVLAAAGPAFATSRSISRSPLSIVLPALPTGQVIEEPYRATVTDLGRRHPVTRGLPGSTGGAEGAPQWGRWFRLIDADIDRGDVVLSGTGERPLMVLNREGEGRVALLLSDHAWLWARGYEGGGPQAELLRRLAHWLMKEPELEEESLSAELVSDRLTVTRRTIGEAVEPVVITAPTGEDSSLTLAEIAPGLWQATMDAPVSGFYRLSSGDLSAVAAAGASRTKELADVIASAVPLSPIAEATGGGLFWTGEVGSDEITLPDLRFVREGRATSGTSWAGLLRRDAYVVTGASTYPLMTGLLAAAILLGFMGLTWFREGR